VLEVGGEYPGNVEARQSMKLDSSAVQIIDSAVMCAFACGIFIDRTEMRFTDPPPTKY